MSWNRRDFLRTAGLGAFGLTLLGPHASASDSSKWGDYPLKASKFMVPPALQAKKVLELYLGGGFSPWETFYTVDDKSFGFADAAFWWTFQSGKDSVSAWFKTCEGSNAGPLTVPWVTDTLGKQVKLGPHLAALRARKDIVARLRVLVTQHTLLAHGVALPLALTGHGGGSPRQAGLGAAVAHHARTHAKGLLPEPVAYVVMPQVGGNIIEPAQAVGVYPGSARPIMIRMTLGSSFAETLKRTTVGKHAAASDKLLAMYNAQYRQRLVHPGHATAVRAPAVADHDFTASLLASSTSISASFDASLFAAKAGSTCGYSKAHSPTRGALDLAVHLLQRKGSPVRHVTVADTGFAPAFRGYDTHRTHIAHASMMHHHVWQTLVAKINKPGEKDPAKIDLDETMIVINTEFGRSPKVQLKDGEKTGRNHWPYAYTTAFIGGPIGKKQAGLLGAITNKGLAVGGITPLQQRAAVLAAMGIFPFSQETFPVGQIPGGDDAGASKWLRDVVLGFG